VLREIATRLARLANSSMLTARIGGDEFAALLLDVGDDLQVEQQIHRLVADCAGVIQIGTELIAFQVAAGASRVPLHCDPDTALLRAEIALDGARGARSR
jgi:GGDEF domain-containing protein